MSNVELLDAVIKILNKYPLDTVEDSAPKPVTLGQKENLQPDIVISESFCRKN